MVIIGLMGAKQSGKSTVANYLINNYDFTERAFADSLKEATRSLFLFNDEQLYGSEKEIPDDRWYGCTPRKVLQFIGTELLRDNLAQIIPPLGKDIFIHHMKLWIEENKNNISNLVISDVRFENEASVIHEMGGYLILIERPNNINNDNHASEKGLKDINLPYYHIINDSTLDDLYKKINLYINSNINLNIKST